MVSKRMQKIIGNVTSCAVNGDGVQVGMAYVDKRFTREGLKVGILPLSGSNKDGVVELKIGNKIPLYDDALIISRFGEENM